MVTRVHDNTTVARADTHPTGTAGFTDCDVFIIRVADDTDCGTAVYVNLTQFAGRKTEQCIVAFFSDELSRSTSGANDLCAFADFQFNVVYYSTKRNLAEGQCIPDLDIGFRAADDDVADFEAVRSDDIFLFAICIVQKSDVCRAVRIVFDRCYFCRDIVFNTFEVDQTITAFMTAALMANRHSALIVTTALARYFREQGFFRCGRRDFIESRNCHETAAGGIRFKRFNGHFGASSFISVLLKLQRIRWIRLPEVLRWLSCSPDAYQCIYPCV